MKRGKKSPPGDLRCSANADGQPSRPAASASSFLRNVKVENGDVKRLEDHEPGNKNKETKTKLSSPVSQETIATESRKAKVSSGKEKKERKLITKASAVSSVMCNLSSNLLVADNSSSQQEEDFVGDDDPDYDPSGGAAATRNQTRGGWPPADADAARAAAACAAMSGEANRPPVCVDDNASVGGDPDYQEGDSESDEGPRKKKGKGKAKRGKVPRANLV
jgi:hypothetical protein